MGSFPHFRGENKKYLKTPSSTLRKNKIAGYFISQLSIFRGYVSFGERTLRYVDMLMVFCQDFLLDIFHCYLSVYQGVTCLTPKNGGGIGRWFSFRVMFIARPRPSFSGCFFGIPNEVLGWFKKKYQDFDCMGAFFETLIPGSSKNLWLFTRKTDQKAEMLHIWKIQVYLSAYHYLGLP